MLTTLLAGVLLAAPEPKLPVAVIDSARATTVQRGTAKLAASESDVLWPGDALAVSEKGELTFTLLTDGRRLRLKPGKNATLSEKGVEPADAVEEAPGPRPNAQLLKMLRESYRSRASSGAAMGVGRGPEDGVDSSKARGVSPFTASRVATDHPTLSWPAASGAKAYRVQVCVFLALENAPKPLWTSVTTEPHLAYPEEEKVLTPGGKYLWTVTAVRDAGKDEQIVEASFFTMTERELERLAQVQRFAAGSDPSGWLIAADAYDAARVYGKALPLYEKLAAHSPRVAGYQLALAAYYTRAGRDAEATKALERARELSADPGRK